MGTRQVRVAEQDFQQVADLTGMGPEVPFAIRFRALLRKCIENEHQSMRTAVREEIERVTGA